MAELIFYMVIMSITPGPNTILSMANAASVGLKKGIRLNFGMAVGITIVALISLAAVELLYAFIPTAERVMRILAFCYLVYLAAKMLRLGVKDSEAVQCGFFKGLILQLVNVKVFFLALTALTTYILPMEAGMVETVALTLMIPLVCFLSGLVWAIAGSILKHLFQKYARVFGVVFAISLLWCAWRALI